MTAGPNPTYRSGYWMDETSGVLRPAVVACHMPKVMSAAESELFQKLHASFCARKEESNHACVGRVIMDRNGVTLSCPLCGDHRSVHGGVAQPLKRDVEFPPESEVSAGGAADTGVTG